MHDPDRPPRWYTLPEGELRDLLARSHCGESPGALMAELRPDSETEDVDPLWRVDDFDQAIGGRGVILCDGLGRLRLYLRRRQCPACGDNPLMPPCRTCGDTGRVKR